jgi:hypothetical protein
VPADTLRTRSLLDESGEDRPWHELADALPGGAARAVAAAASPLADAAVEAATARAEALLAAEAAAFQRRLAKTRPGDAQWLQAVRSTF